MSVETVETGQTLQAAPSGNVTSRSDANEKPRRLDSYRLLLATHPVVRNIALVLCVALIAAAFVVVWFAWFELLPDLWSWAFAEFSFSKNIFGAFGVFFLALSPIYAPVGAFRATTYVVEVYADETAFQSH